MTFEEKLVLAAKELEASSIRKSNYNPPLMQLLQKLGVKTPPPHYNSFVKNFAITGSFFGFFWGLLMYLVSWHSTGLAISFMLFVVAFAGLTFGLLMASYYHFSARKHKLTPWNNLGTQVN